MFKNTIYLILFFSLLSTAKVCAQREKIDRGIQDVLFIPKGTWMGGASFSYSEQTSSNYEFLVLKKMKADGYTFRVSPYAGYFIANNVAVGARFNYTRTYADIGNIEINLGDDLNFEIKDYEYIEHSFSGGGFLRTYIGLGNGKIFGFFNELRLSYSYGQGKDVSGKGNDVNGTFQTINKLEIGSAPGLTAFVTNNTAVEVSIGLVGFNSKWVNQKYNQVEKGYYRKSSANFKVDLFSISIGMTMYL